MNAIEKIIETLENYVVPSQLDDARAELAALREVAEAANEIEPDDLRTLLPNSSTNLLTALAKLAAVKGGQK